MNQQFKNFNKAITILFALLLGFAFYKFPTIPFHVCDKGYCDKLGNVVPESLYDLYLYWWMLFIPIAVLGVILSIILAINDEF